jgi:hypothetical protein
VAASAIANQTERSLGINDNGLCKLVVVGGLKQLTTKPFIL